MNDILSNPNRQEIIRNGVMLSVISIVVSQSVTLLTFQMSSQMAVWMLYLVMFGLALFLNFFFVRKAVLNIRDKYSDGKTTFGKAFIIALTTGLLATIIQSLFMLILFLLFKNFYDSNNEKLMMASIDWMENNGAPAESIDQVYDGIEKMKNTTPLESFIDIFYKSAIFSLIVALLIAAFVKKEKVNENGFPG
jgi:hypothetical protein